MAWLIKIVSFDGTNPPMPGPCYVKDYTPPPNAHLETTQREDDALQFGTMDEALSYWRTNVWGNPDASADMMRIKNISITAVRTHNGADVIAFRNFS